MKVRQSKNSIKCLLDSNGKRIKDPSEIKQMVIDFYQKWLVGASSALNETNMTGRVATLLSDLLPKNVKGFLQMNATEEIQKYIFSLGFTALFWQNPRTFDGFIALFFTEAWSIVKPNVIEAIASIFKSAHLGEVNSTIITRVPKVATL